MRGVLQDIEEFMRATGQDVQRRPEVPDDKTVALRRSLVREEARELDEALEIGDITHIAKEMSDLLYVLAGTALAYGIPLDVVHDEVHRSNMTKFVDGKAVYREDGKVMKGPNYRPPDIERLLGAISE